MNATQMTLLHTILVVLWSYGFATELNRFVHEAVQHSFSGTFRGWVSGVLLPINHFTFFSLLVATVVAVLVFIMWPVCFIWRISRGES